MQKEVYKVRRRNGRSLTDVTLFEAIEGNVEELATDGGGVVESQSAQIIRLAQIVGVLASRLNQHGLLVESDLKVMLPFGFEIRPFVVKEKK